MLEFGDLVVWGGCENDGPFSGLLNAALVFRVPEPQPPMCRVQGDDVGGSAGLFRFFLACRPSIYIYIYACIPICPYIPTYLSVDPYK